MPISPGTGGVGNSAGSPDLLPNIPETPDPNTTFPRTVLSMLQLAEIGYWAGFTDAQTLATIVAISIAESGGDTGIQQSQGLPYWGCLQIGVIPVHQVTITQATNPFFAFQWAYQNSNGGQNFQPWETFTNGAYRQFFTAASSYAQQVVEMKLPIGIDGTQTDSSGNPIQVTLGNLQASGYQGKPSDTIYGPVKIWQASDIVVSGTANVSDGKGLDKLVYGTTNLASFLVSAQVTLSSTQSSTLTLVFENGDLLLRDGRLFPSVQPQEFIFMNGLQMQVSQVETEADAAGRTQLTVTAMASGVMAMMNLFDKSVLAPVGSESATTWLGRVYAYVNNVQAAKAKVIAQDSAENSGNIAAYDPVGDPASGTPPDSGWTYFQKLQSSLGFWGYEAKGVMYFGRPSILCSWGNEVLVTYAAPGETVKPTNSIGPPRFSAAIQNTPNGFAQVQTRTVQRTVEVDIPQWYGCQVKPGDTLVIQGFSGNFDNNKTGAGLGKNPPKDSARHPYIVTQVQWNIDGGLSPVTITAEEAIDPTPQLPDESTTGTAPNGLPGAATTTWPNQVMAQLPASFQISAGTPAQVVTAIDYAISKLGDPYVGGATGPNSFDCSGLTQAAYAAAGISISRTTYTQVNDGVGVPSVNQILPGDLVFIMGSDPGPNGAPGHVGLYVGDGLIVAADHGGVPIRVDTLASWGPPVAIRRIVTTPPTPSTLVLVPSANGLVIAGTGSTAGPASPPGRVKTPLG